jgi:putative membrane protein
LAVPVDDTVPAPYADSMKLIAKVLVTALALVLVAEFLPGFTVNGMYPALIGALILGLLNVTVKPILIILTLPISIITLGLFIFVINASLLWFTASFIEGISVDSFLTALLASVIISVISALGNRFIS